MDKNLIEITGKEDGYSRPIKLLVEMPGGTGSGFGLGGFFIMLGLISAAMIIADKL